MGWACCCTRRCAGSNCGSDSAPRSRQSFGRWSRPILQRFELEYRWSFGNGDCNVKLEYIPLTGTFLRLQPFAPDLTAEVPSPVDCDPDTWAIMPINPMGDGFDVYWSAACGAPPGQRMAYAIRQCSNDRVIGMSTYYPEVRSQGRRMNRKPFPPSVGPQRARQSGGEIVDVGPRL